MTEKKQITPQTPHRTNSQRGTLAFIFNSDLTEVLLILKNRPAWAAGQYNGVGGKHEAGESDQACTSREVMEESGLLIAPESWQTVAHIEWQDWDGGVLTTIYDGKQSDARSVTDEPVSWHRLDELPQNCRTNLLWLIPLCKDALVEKSTQKLYCTVTYSPWE